MKRLLIIVVVIFTFGCSSSDSVSPSISDINDMTGDMSDAGYPKVKQTCVLMDLVDSKVCEPAQINVREIGFYDGVLEEQSCTIYMINPEQDCVTDLGCQEPHIRDDLISKGWIVINEFPPRCETIDPDLGIPEPDMG